MKSSILFNFLVNKEKNTITVERSFNAPLELVWAAWTESELIDQWWAPKPYQAVTKSQDFKEGGRWHYYMESPEGERHWCLFDYERIEPMKSYAGLDAFCDENQVFNTVMPRTHWKNEFKSQGDTTLVTANLSYNSLADLESIIQLGFKEGFTACMENLDQYIAAQFYLRKQKKPSNKARTTSYLNFPGNTAEAFEFYRSVFRSEFVKGIQRFGDLPADSAHPPVPEEIKKMVLHVELPIVGGHVLMGTDAPKEMGFTLIQGNNMHISLEPESREEADRLFQELSAGGKVDMPMQDMFFGAYFGSFKDQYGINWMISYQLA